MILKHADDKQPDIDILHNLAAQAGSQRQRQAVQEEIDNIVAGMRGEQDASYYLDQEFRHRDDSVVIHDLRIEEEGDVAQIDHIVISRSRQAFVLETKALKASLECNSAGEWEAVYGRSRYAIPSPLEQCKRHAAALRRWLGRRETAIREVIPVVLVAPTTKLGQRAASRDDPDIVKSDLFTRWYEQRSSGNAHQVVQRGNERMSEDELAGVGYRLVRAHTPIQFDWRRRFGFPTSKGEEEAAAPMAAVAPPSEEPITAPDGTARRKHIGKTDVPIAGGNLVVFRYENGDRGIRCDDDSMKRRVSDLCRAHHGRWAPYPRFWMVSLEACRSIIVELGGIVPDTSTASMNTATGPSTPMAKPNMPLVAEPMTPAAIPVPMTIPKPTTAVEKITSSADGVVVAEEPSIPTIIQTGDGTITIARLKDGRYTVKNDGSPRMIDLVRTTCRKRAKWNPLFKNWIVEPSMIATISRELGAKG
jgi:hypothetical protein